MKSTGRNALEKYVQSFDMTAQAYVEPRVFEIMYRHVLDLQANHVILLGAAGSGKTSLLIHLMKRLKEQGHLVLFMGLHGSESLDEIVTRLVAQLVNEAEELAVASSEELNELRHIRGENIHVRRSDASVVIQHTLEVLAEILGEKRRIFIIFDGLDENPNSLVIERMLDWVINILPSRARIVLASRSRLQSGTNQQLRRFTVFNLENLSVEEVARLVHGSLDEKQLPSVIAEEIIAKSNGDLLVAKMMVSEALHKLQLPQVNQADNKISEDLLASAIENFNSIWDNTHKSRSLFLLSVILQPISLSSLSSCVRLPVDRIEAWAKAAEQACFLLIENDVVVLNAMLTRHLIARDILVEEIGIAQLEFGDEAAERDGLFGSSFVPPTDIRPIAEGKKTIVLGDRGAGKSAIFRALCDTAVRVKSEDTIVACAQNPSDFLQQLSSSGQVSSAEKFKAIWLLYVATLSARELQVYTNTTSAEYLHYARDARKLLRRLGRGEEIVGEGHLSRLVTRLRAILPDKVSFTVGPVKIEQSLSQGGSDGNSMDVSGFLTQTDKILHALKKRIVIVFDQVDEAHKYDRTLQESLIQGLFLAESWLSQTKAMRLVVLLRTDLFEIYDIQEKNKFVSRTARLAWTPTQLLSQLLSRAYANTQLKKVRQRLRESTADDDVFTEIQLRVLFPAEVEGKAFRQWLIDGLSTGNERVSPRQIILFLNMVKDKVEKLLSVRRIPLCTEMQVADALTELSELSYQEVISDFRVATGFVQNCRAGKLTRFNLKDVSLLFEASEGSQAQQVEQLQRLGFLERSIVLENGNMVSEFRIPPLFTRCWK